MRKKLGQTDDEIRAAKKWYKAVSASTDIPTKTAAAACLKKTDDISHPTGFCLDSSAANKACEEANLTLLQNAYKPNAEKFTFDLCTPTLAGVDQALNAGLYDKKLEHFYKDLLQVMTVGII